MTVMAVHAHTLIIPQGYDAQAAWMERWVFGELLVPSTHPATALVWWCDSTACPEGSSGAA